tara:strand:+ start:775 stop:1644 length:870 start_codon:yes stop_codon:yes gene_type:complete
MIEMRQGIDIPDVNIPRTTSLAGSHVLPARPYEPKMHNFDSVDITKSTLPAHNASLQVGNSLNAGPRPAPTVVHDTMAGAGARPNPNGDFRVLDSSIAMLNQPEQRPPVHGADRDLGRYDMRGQGLHPGEHIDIRPNHNLEMYGIPASPNTTELDIARTEVRLNSLPTNHGVDAVFGGNPYEAKQHDYIRPVPATVNVPQVRIPKTVRREPIIQMPIIPAPPRINMPRLPRVTAAPMQVEAKPVTPPITGNDLGIGGHAKLLSGTNKNMGPMGISAGRSFGAEGNMSPF